ncbi:hypothetical protein C6V07_02295 [Burkholderia gladioli]|nr:hypothetical protein C6V07_02295 [Burkholderia gladioli]
MLAPCSAVVSQAGDGDDEACTVEAKITGHIRPEATAGDVLLTASDLGGETMRPGLAAWRAGVRGTSRARRGCPDAARRPAPG